MTQEEMNLLKDMTRKEFVALKIRDARVAVLSDSYFRVLEDKIMSVYSVASVKIDRSTGGKVVVVLTKDQEELLKYYDSQREAIIKSHCKRLEEYGIYIDNLDGIDL